MSRTETTRNAGPGGRRPVPLLAVPLLLLALPIAWLGLNPAVASDSAREGDLPAELGEFHLAREYAIEGRQARMLGTEDAIWRAYADADGGVAYLFAVFHREDWKSIHSPETCLLGSDMTLTGRSFEPIDVDGRTVMAERLLLRQNQTGEPLVSWYVFLADGLSTGNYWEFVRFHLGRALVRSSRPGCLLRIDVEARTDDEIETADRRARALLELAVPQASRMLR